MAGVLDFFKTDYPTTLFPLRTNLLLIERGHKEISDYIYSGILSGKEQGFLPQQRAYATKPKHHLRRTFKLDPVAEYFIYDVVYRNRSRFRKPVAPNRQFFGYRFENGAPIVGRKAYADFREAVYKRREKHRHELSFDIAAYFNSIYHHDLVPWFTSIGAKEDDAQALGRYLREINAGRSVDCLPQGLYPCKMLGNGFLSFVETSERIRSRETVRFMDDFYFFDQDAGVLLDDFARVQRLLGEKGLSVNPQKTKLPEDPVDDAGQELDDIKLALLEKRREVKASGLEGTNDEDEEEEDAGQLEPEQREYLLDLLRNKDLDESDAELVLSVMHEHSDEISEHFVQLTSKFPNLAQELYHFCRHVPDKEELAAGVLRFLKEAEQPTEFQLFWLGAMVEDHLLKTTKAGTLMQRLMDHKAATPISKAKILEIPENRFGMPDLREEYLRSGRSDWTAWAAAIGSRSLPPDRRNYVTKYFSKGSPMNALISRCLPLVAHVPASV